LTGLEGYLFSGGAGFALGAISGFALKRILKLAAIILGVFFLGLMYLSYKGLISANWNVIQDQTQSGLYNATQAAANYIQSATQQLSQHPAVLHGQGMTIAAGIMFVPGFLVGIRH
jgi:uncharacterized membrane protein (Fun14 family)